MLATPDAREVELVTPDSKPGEWGECLLEVKAPSAFAKKFWSGGPPLNYQIQCLHQMVVTGIRRAKLVVLFGGRDLQVHPVEWHEDAALELVERCRAFWKDIEEAKAA